ILYGGYLSVSSLPCGCLLTYHTGHVASSSGRRCCLDAPRPEKPQRPVLRTARPIPLSEPLSPPRLSPPGDRREPVRRSPGLPPACLPPADDPPEPDPIARASGVRRYHSSRAVFSAF